MNIRNDPLQVVQTARAALESKGYCVIEEVIDCLKLGLPQTRKRHILIAIKDASSPLLETIEALRVEPRPLQWAIEDLVGVEQSTVFDTPAQLTEVNRQRIEHLFESGEYNMPNSIRPESHRYGHTYPSVYGRLRWDKPSGTITTGYHTPGRGRFIHPSEQRTLTPHEAARIQGFPDAFEFLYEDGSPVTRQVLARGIGEAVPPKLGYACTLAALAALRADRLSKAPPPTPAPHPVRRRRSPSDGPVG